MKDLLYTPTDFTLEAHLLNKYLSEKIDHLPCLIVDRFYTLGIVFISDTVHLTFEQWKVKYGYSKQMSDNLIK